ncbi:MULTISPECIES: bifunctional 23S rRNA (guanine(2069)-N(7))-methyltransferase RlmK/23S rRNA (guanine(2445)-N(2))-methyltransferase RlmL [unclassified Wenzhouxiangella]|uniref:bifunctional 23S rRNA (guanine(2069)-N(7))-methyltransferase RlmK/23S rRNA (guanine(2445)-N(2))-methyltransferase RlmL n=1 Tax=unclassified Wenzhouxiangella TaxID=2613841 RepID=UPI000E326E52|nr:MULTISPECIES: bifunctional 23S rRNA (guanine(2069)-N(7))-methyltransferase RlmK/23S rRNA (guanine(2445)-N(2))-methyltransferase RlmL [unclassified Wenzhouxiangella]RFF28981.1 bifunctional 23S rRNA (guanine(2069)-N(7))-methyltransferase RlmK/23S rRNA (guanine(2445)-N(2))-methyltransferase RlmL [Wenzhouxiangella sp. 15181]RFP68311.1 bifunctional 23S rRNA (guanine(2069)-N(7))-methyltransferase RlmK/23S rRNA (guanine(2445)-N(2))-methyltransferase RlmL [Wenzhouxiangella sp. 15190]
MNKRFTLFATAPRGLHDLLATELTALGLEGVHPQRGGVLFEGTLVDAYRVCLWSRIANRVLLPIAEFQAEDDDGLYRGVSTIDWSMHLGPDNTLAVDFTGIKAAITHSRFAAQRVKDAVVDQIRETVGGRPSVDIRQPDVRINVHMHGEQVTVAIDLSGDSLHKRGYRETGIAAPLKENLAAAMLYRADWPRIAADRGGFVDPMCGTGTLAIEAAWMASDTAPGLLRTGFGFQHWRGHDDNAWKDLVDEALERQEKGMEHLPPMVAFDHDRQAVRLALVNVERAGLAGRVHVERRELGEATAPSGVRTGLVATNPPYGERIGEQHELLPLYLKLGETLRSHFPGWRALVLNGAGCRIGLQPDKSWQFFNGPLECRLERFEIGADAAASTGEQAAPDLTNRLHKNERQLRKWRKREGITCYRLYDADIPEYALAVDVYGSESGDWLHVQEYEPPSSVDPGKAQNRLRAALSAIPAAAGVPPERMVFKVRRRQRGSEQYERMSEQSRTLIVREGHCRLEVNLTDYLDTGLFLDHRPVRQWLAEHAHGKRLLNLFCYTGAATVHAALGGARATTSVDLSNTYLDWLRRNLELNGCDMDRHHVIHADARDWLARCRNRFDLIFLDPPSFSNSKRMDGDLDIQRDHAELVAEAMRCLDHAGTLVFSTNLRSFSLDAAIEQAFEVEDRTRWSIPKDFERNRRIHQCWFIRHREGAASDDPGQSGLG